MRVNPEQSPQNRFGRIHKRGREADTYGRVRPLRKQGEEGEMSRISRGDVPIFCGKCFSSSKID